MYTFKSTGTDIKEKKSEEIMEIFNYIADNFKFEVDELDVSDSFLNSKENKRLDSLLSKIG